MGSVIIQNHNKTMTTTMLVAKKRNSRKVNQKLENPHRGTQLCSKRTIVYKMHSTRHVKLTRTESRDENSRSRKKTFDELKSNYRQALLSQYHDLVELGNILKKDKTHKQIIATTQR